MNGSRRGFLTRLAGSVPASWLAFEQQMEGAGGATSEEYWAVVKRQFPLADGLIYLNAANVCPSSRPVLDRHQEYLRDFHADPSFQNREKYERLQESLRTKLAGLLRAETDEIAVTRNTSEGANIIVNGIDLKAGDEVIVTTHNHPSSYDSWKVRAKRHGLVVREAVTPVTAQSAQELVDSVAKLMNGRTRVMVVTQVTSTTGNRYPVKEIGELARGKGIWYHVDGAQTFGALDVSVKEIGCDSYAGSAHKWFMGPLEAGVLYVKKERIAQLWPSVVTAGWGESVRGARRYEVFGQRDNPRLVAFEAAVDFIQMVGMKNVEGRLERLVTHLKERLAGVSGVKIKTPMAWGLSGGVVKFTVASKKTAQLYEELYRKHRVALASTPGGESEGLRFSPHVYNTLAEIEEAARIVARVSRS